MLERLGKSGGATLMELIVVLSVLSIVGAITLPMVGNGPHRTAALRAAQRFATAVRMAQAAAQDGDVRVRVALLEDGGFAVERQTADGWVRELHGAIAPVECGTNYPGERVDFTAAGLPLVGGSLTPRAGTFRFTYGGAERSVVLQLTGRVRVR